MARGSIRSRTTWALFLVGGLAALAVGAVSMRTMADELYAQAAAANLQRARAIRGHVAARIQGGRELLEAVAADLAEGGEPRLEPRALDRALGHALRFNPLFYSIYAYDAEGEVLLRRYLEGEEGDEGRSTNLFEKTDVPFVRVARATLEDGKTRFLGVRLSPWGNLFIPCMAAVVDGRGEARALLSGAISAAGRGFEEMIEGLAPRGRGYIMLLDDKRRVLAGTRNAPVVGSARFEFETELEWGHPLLVREGARDLFAEERIPEMGVRILVAVPRDVALAALPEALVEIAVTTLAALVVAGLLGGWLAGRLTGPIAGLLEGIQRVGDGVLTHRVEVRGDDELAEVSRAFNRLAESLARNRMVEEFWNDPDLGGEEEAEDEGAGSGEQDESGEPA